METFTEKIEGTPFLKRWEKDNGYSFGLAGYRISNWYETEEEMLNEILNKNWNTIEGLINVIVDATLKMNNLIK